MAIETQPESAQVPGGGDPGATPKQRNFWLSPGIHTAVIGAVAGYFLGHWLGNFIGSGYQQVPFSDDNDFAIVLGFSFLIIGWLIGLGVFDDVVRQMLGRPIRSADHHANVVGMAKYFRYTLDHKVVGLQYLVGMLIYFFTGGLLAIAIRTELLSPSYHIMSPTTYLEVVGEHGTMMMMMMTSLILGPFGNYLVPLMIGSKRVAFPRIEALSFWLTPCAFLILLSSFLLGGFPTGWTGYAPLSIQAGEGMDSYAVAFGLMGFSIIMAGFNIVVTIICYRAPGMRWSRLPMFVWAMLTTGFLLVLAAPVLVGGMYMIITDRTVQTAFFVDQLGGNAYLYENLFWFFGHPEVYILALPGFGIMCELLPVFTRKPLFGYKVAAAGMFGVAALSFFVWQHHLFDLRHEPGHAAAVHADDGADLDPDGAHLPGRDGHLLAGEDPADDPDAVRHRVLRQLPDRRHLGRVPVGRARGHHRARQLLRDGALPLHDHGRPDLRVLRRRLLLAAEGHGAHAERAAGQDPLLDDVHRVQLHVLAAVRGRPARPAAPGLGVRGRPADAERLGVDLRVLPGRLAVHLHLQLRDVHGDLAQARAAEPVERPRPGVAGLLAAAGQQLRAHPGGPGRPVRVRRPGRAAGGGPVSAGRRDRRRPGQPGQRRSTGTEA